MTDIVGFLTARLDEDEAAAKGVGVGFRDTWHTIEWYDGQFEGGRTVNVDIHGLAGTPITSRGALLRVDGEHIARYDPARVLREVTAKRRVLMRHHADGPDDPSCAGCGFNNQEERMVADVNDCPELRDLASPYDNHPDYNPAWRVE